MVEVPGTEKDCQADLVLLAMGFVEPGRRDARRLRRRKDARGNAKAGTDVHGGYATSVPKVFAAGDMRRGQSLVVWAIREGRQAARAVDVPDGLQRPAPLRRRAADGARGRAVRRRRASCCAHATPDRASTASGRFTRGSGTTLRFADNAAPGNPVSCRVRKAPDRFVRELPMRRRPPRSSNAAASRPECRLELRNLHRHRPRHVRLRREPHDPRRRVASLRRAARSRRILGASGCGKTTLLRLIGGRSSAAAGPRDVRRRAGRPAPTASGCTRMRRRMGMLFQFGALFTDLTVFDNVAFPLREHTELQRTHDPRHRADEAQCGRPARRRASCASPRSRAAWRAASRSRAPSRWIPT